MYTKLFFDMFLCFNTSAPFFANQVTYINVKLSEFGFLVGTLLSMNSLNNNVLNYGDIRILLP